MEKTYSYIPGMMAPILNMRCEDKQPLKKRRPLRPDDPRRIVVRLAPKTPPPVADIRAKRAMSRFGELGGIDN